MSISKAMTIDFESIFYVDVVTDFYFEFCMGKGGDLEIRPGSVNFFDAWERMLENVSGSASQAIKEAIIIL